MGKSQVYLKLVIVILLAGIGISNLGAQKQNGEIAGVLREAKKTLVAIECSVKGKTCYGTGFFVHPSGVIATSPSTVPPNEARKIRVLRVKEGEMKGYRAKLLSSVEEKDLVLVRIRGRGFPVPSFGNPGDATPGRIVFSIGNGEQIMRRNADFYTGRGVVSGRYEPGSRNEFVPSKFATTIRERSGKFLSVKREKWYSGTFIETTAPVNCGRDGGILIDINGNVLGMLSLSYSRHRWLSLVVPIWKLEKPINNQLRKMGLEPGDNDRREKKQLKELRTLQSKYRKAFRKGKNWTVGVRVKRDDKDEPKNKKEALKKSYRPGPSSPLTATRVSGNGYFVTSRSRLMDPGKIRSLSVVLPVGQTKSARVVETDEELDLALLKAKETNGEGPPEADRSSYKPGTFLVLPGRAPDPDSPNLTTGMVSTPPGERNGILLADVDVNPGNVGGPVVNLAGGVIGVTVQSEKIGTNQRLHRVVPIEKIRKQFDDLK